MRTVFGATTLVLLSFMLMISCGRETKQTNTTQPTGSTAPLAQRAYVQGKTVTMMCNSSCTDPSSSGMILNLVDGSATCACKEGDSELALEGLDDSLTSGQDMAAAGKAMELFSEDLGAFMTDEYGSPDVIYDSIAITLYDYAKVMTVKYRVPNTTDVTSLMVVAYYDQSNLQLKKRVSIKCSGNYCECFAQFIAATGTLRCSCSDQSYCNPVIKETTNPPTKTHLLTY